MGKRLAGKVAIVTGGASGIGAARCRLSARQGAQGSVPGSPGEFSCAQVSVHHHDHVAVGLEIKPGEGCREGLPGGRIHPGGSLEPGGQNLPSTGRLPGPGIARCRCSGCSSPGHRPVGQHSRRPDRGRGIPPAPAGWLSLPRPPSRFWWASRLSRHDDPTSTVMIVPGPPALGASGVARSAQKWNPQRPLESLWGVTPRKNRLWASGSGCLDNAR